MTRLETLIKRLWGRFRGHFSMLLPQSRDEFNALCEHICFVYGFVDAQSYREVIANEIIHANGTRDRIPDIYFARVLRKAMANKAAFSFTEEVRDARRNSDLKFKQQQEQKAQEAKDAAVALEGTQLSTA